jgi:hypothetical protein
MFRDLGSKASPKSAQVFLRPMTPNSGSAGYSNLSEIDPDGHGTPVCVKQTNGLAPRCKRFHPILKRPILPDHVALNTGVSLIYSTMIVFCMSDLRMPVKEHQ